MSNTMNTDCNLPDPSGLQVADYALTARLKEVPRGPFISRREWQARPGDLGPGKLSPLVVRGIALHWPGMKTKLETISGVCAALRSWQNFHMDDNGWSDIAYQGAVDQMGNYYKLRGLRNQSAANGDAATNERYGALLLVLAIGEKPTADMTRTVRRTIRRFQSHFPRGKAIVPHSEIRPEPTQCPGDIVRRMIADDDFRPIRRP